MLGPHHYPAPPSYGGFGGAFPPPDPYLPYGPPPHGYPPPVGPPPCSGLLPPPHRPPLQVAAGSGAFSGDSNLYPWYRVAYLGGIELRQSPSIDAPRCGVLLSQNSTFAVAEEFLGSDGRLYLRLADGRGWAFDDAALYPQDPAVVRGFWSPVGPGPAAPSHSPAAPLTGLAPGFDPVSYLAGVDHALHSPWAQLPPAPEAHLPGVHMPPHPELHHQADAHAAADRAAAQTAAQAAHAAWSSPEAAPSEALPPQQTQQNGVPEAHAGTAPAAARS
eukprot:TRINITY_DN93037_c0_g1_i1.p1 TRINITY_DN93037_c0_g1~~TRINITY_DN93037_c0_g1_i1.p1  ORF type:complete len:275 (+),score=31.15 TRINITY_DN93037_c0_g1_i1:28-852(+)